jgi:hypothetical protein
MNVYFAGTEDIDFTLFGAAVYQAFAYRPAWTRCGVTPNNNPGINRTLTDPPTDRCATPQFTPISAFWTHGQFFASALSAQANSQIIRWLDSGGTCRLSLRVVSGTSPATWGVFTHNAAGTYTQLGATFAPGIPASVVTAIDADINYSASGHFNLYVGGLSAFTYSGNLLTDSATAIAQVEFSDYTNAFNGVNIGWSECIVADSDTRSCNLWLLNSSTAGNAQTWSGTASNVNKGQINDATYISAASAGLINEYRSGGIALPGGTYTVATVKMSSRALVGAAGPQHVEYVTRVGSTDYVGGSWSPPVSAFANDAQNYMQAINPGTGIAWTTGDLTATTFNYGVESVA